VETLKGGAVVIDGWVVPVDVQRQIRRLHGDSAG
jgi:hypothetical protein